MAVGRNYREHVREMGGAPDEDPPVLFLKPASAIVADGGVVARPPYSLSLHHELELVLAIGTGGRRISAETALDHVLGYAVGLDMTLRDVQAAAKRRGHPWAVAKGFDTSAPVSAVVPAALVPDPNDLAIELKVNGELRQHGRASEMILGIPALLAFVSSVFTLEPGDLVFTGTPAGVGEVYPGDLLHASLLGHVELRVNIIDEDAGLLAAEDSASATDPSSGRVH
ncbi:MAG TPA: fumarylacetoacetate hydrolase family protein [Candidatus Udaeobacter sp.]|nr:fumarylacetoacetate hydrolase family protein [Candidatus Udaeobacter sp.]